MAMKIQMVTNGRSSVCVGVKGAAHTHTLRSVFFLAWRGGVVAFWLAAMVFFLVATGDMFLVERRSARRQAIRGHVAQSAVWGPDHPVVKLTNSYAFPVR